LNREAAVDEANAGRRRDTGLAFFGTVTAGVSHDLNNVISTIDQVAGLLADLVAGAEAGRPVPLERLQTVYERLKRQTTRGAEIIKRLNTFAHSTDEPWREVALDVLLADLLAIGQRYVDLRKAQLELPVPAAPLRIVSDPFRLQQAIFAALQRLLGSVAAGDMITVALAGEGEKAAITMTGPARSAATGEDTDWTHLESLLAILGGTAERSVAAERETMILRIPKEPPPASAGTEA
jgi:C4-dicarboxylate-specific signal transduction histidine kinase